MFLKTIEVCETLGISRATVYNCRLKAEVAVQKVGNILLWDVGDIKALAALQREMEDRLGEKPTMPALLAAWRQETGDDDESGSKARGN